MPELPEVETMVRDLTPRLDGRQIIGVDAPFVGIIRYPEYEEFRRRVVGQSIVAVTRRGKYAIIHLASGDLLIVHRGMTGSLLDRSAQDPPERHLRLVLHLDNGRQLRLDDQRKFGKVYVLSSSGEERALPWATFGPEPLDDSFDLATFAETLSRRTALLKPLLLSQRVVAGLGNIYVDEALFLARIHPERRAGTLVADEVRQLHAAIRTVLTAAVRGRGTTFDSYMDIEGRSGSYQQRLRVFNRTGEPCPRCGTPIVKTVVGGRGTHYCPSCQES